MPNHITNILKAPPEVIAALAGPESVVDFSAIIPQPDGLNVTCSCAAEDMAQLITGQISLNPVRGNSMESLTDGLRLSNVLRSLQNGGITKWQEKDFETFVAMLRNFRSCGYFSWYDWNCQHWGTKWNAYESKAIPGGVSFETAWSAPHVVIAALAARFPDATIEHLWADEDIGSNCGTRVYRGTLLTEYPPDDPVDFALIITGNDREYYRANPDTGRWEYFDKDDEEEEISVN